MNKAGKVILSLVSVLLVVGVALSVVLVVHNKHANANANGNANKEVQTSNSLESVCGNTIYKAVCMDTLSPVANNHSADYKDYVRAALQATALQVSKSLNLSDSLLVEASDPQHRDIPKLQMSLQDCKGFLSLAVSNLEIVFSHVESNDLVAIHERSAELKSWLSTVMTYSQSCLNTVEEPKFHNQLKDTLQNASALTDNALVLFAGISDVLETLGLKLNAEPLKGARRLLTVAEANAEFPSWFTEADIKLMAQVNAGGASTNAVVAKDGSGQFNSINAALAANPKRGRYVIHVKAGVYNEYVTVDNSQTNVFMFGDGSRSTIVTGSRSAASGFTTSAGATFTAIGRGFICKSMGFVNTAGPNGHQAVALQVQSEMSAFFDCKMDGYQDTHYVHAGRQFYRNCAISGTVDFIFGDATAVIQNSVITVRRPNPNQFNAVTAQNRGSPSSPTGLVIHGCQIVAEGSLVPVRFNIKSYLGRPWGAYSRTVIMETTIGDFIQPAGWSPWAGNFALNTLFYAEYANRGPGANTANRVKWPGFHVINRNQALSFTTANFIGANSWVPGTGIPYTAGLLA